MTLHTPVRDRDLPTTGQLLGPGLGMEAFHFGLVWFWFWSLGFWFWFWFWLLSL